MNALISRRNFLSGAATVLAALPLMGKLPNGRKPNILFLPVDDLKPLLGCYGEMRIQTPNIDRLARRGSFFLNNHCQQAVCGPTRASLMTGCYPDTTGVWDLKTKMRDVHPDILTLPQYLSQNGYETTGVGKTYDPRCVDKKFDEPSWTQPYQQYAAPSGEVYSLGYHVKPTATRQGEGRENVLSGPPFECLDLPDDRYGDYAVSQVGIELLEKLSKGDKPFFLSVGFSKPHLPFVAPKKYWDLYDPNQVVLAPFQEHAKNEVAFAYHNSDELRNGFTDIPDVGPLSPELQRKLIHGYFASVSFVDAMIGRVLNKLEELGQTQNTLVCLWGDHGWHLGDHGLWCKHTNFEQATRSPLILAGPGIAAGFQTSSPTGFVDVFPTLCRLTDIEMPKSLEGKNLSPLWTDRQSPVNEAVLSQYPRKLGGKDVMGYALRDDRYRLVRWMEVEYRKGERRGKLIAREFYDYQKDPLETVNAVDDPSYASEIARLEAIFKKRGVAQDNDGVVPAAVAAPALTGFGEPQFNGKEKFLTEAKVSVLGQPFLSAWDLTVKEIPESISKAAIKFPVAVPIPKGASIEIEYWSRCPSGNGEMTVLLQNNKGGYKALGKQVVAVSKDFTKSIMTVNAEEVYAEGSLVLTFHLGAKLQLVQVGGCKLTVR